VDLAAIYDLNSRWALTGRITNLLNRHYQIPDAFDQPTLGAFAGVKAKF
jgi:outer membrane cobalamin receptor